MSVEACSTYEGTIPFGRWLAQSAPRIRTRHSRAARGYRSARADLTWLDALGSMRSTNKKSGIAVSEREFGNQHSRCRPDRDRLDPLSRLV